MNLTNTTTNTKSFDNNEFKDKFKNKKEEDVLDYEFCKKYKKS